MTALGLMLAFALGTLLNAVHLALRFRPKGVLKVALFALGLLGLVVLTLSGAAVYQLTGLGLESRSAVLASLNSRQMLVSVAQLVLLMLLGNALLTWRLSRVPNPKA